jgi:hypothetical protein
MERKQEYIARLQAAIQQSYSCRAAHRRTVQVQEALGPGVVWQGEVEIFWLTGHPQAKRCFAWLESAKNNDAESKIVSVLEVPPVIGPATAVRIALAGPGNHASL